ncbi:MAG TPA: AgmX/PglI C-terminal domain-containing protein [Myxococcales bacterium]|nr:AgmX/PglI C-terminal domain-containing protein [Myxococcales bacterium]
MADALQIFVLRNGQLLQSELFGEGLYTVGRSADSDLRLDEEGVEDVHVLLEFANGEVRLSEHDGGSGLLVNGARVSTASVKSGDDVRVGPFVLKTRMLGRKSAPPKAAAPLSAPMPAPTPPPMPAPIAIAPLAPPSRPPAPAPVRPATAPQLRPVAPLRPAPPPVAPAPPQSAAPKLATIPDAELDAFFDAAAEHDAPVVIEDEEASELLKPLEPAPGQLAPAPVATPAVAEQVIEKPAIVERPAVVERPPPAAVKPPPAAVKPPPAAVKPPPAAVKPPPAAVKPPPAAVKPAPAPPPRRTPPPAAGPMVTVERRKPTGSMLMASIFWGDTLVHARTFREGVPVFDDAAGKAALQMHGFSMPPRVRTRGSSWTVAAPPGARAELRTGGGWTAPPSGSKEILLSVGETLRLTQGRFHLELSAQPAPRQARAMFWRNLDKQMALVLVLTATALISFIERLPPPPPERVHEEQQQIIRQVRASIEEKKKEKPKPPPPPPPTEVAEKSPDKTIAKATTLRQAGVPIRSLQKISKATSGLGNLLAKLGPATGIKGGSPTALPLVPTVGAAPAPLPGLGGTGPGGSIGPITKGTEILRGGAGYGLLGSATAGRGGVSGVPVSVPSRPTALKGSIDRDLVAKVINEHVNEMRSCYERALIRQPNLGAGKVLLEWTIDLAGSVTEVRSKSSSLKNDEVVSCLLDVARQMKFPKPAGGIVIVTFPILFNSVGY